MKNFFGESGIEPKIIDYGEDTLNVKYREIDKEDNMCSNVSERDKKKKNKE